MRTACAKEVHSKYNCCHRVITLVFGSFKVKSDLQYSYVLMCSWDCGEERHMNCDQVNVHSLIYGNIV